MEMAEFRKKSSIFYLNMKKSEKIRLLESSVTFFRAECMKMASTIDVLKVNNKRLTVWWKSAQAEVDAWHEEAKTLKFHNIILRNTVHQLKSPQLIEKYEERGRQQAKQEMKRLLS